MEFLNPQGANPFDKWQTWFGFFWFVAPPNHRRMGTLHFAHSMVSAVLGGVKLDSLTVSANSGIGVVWQRLTDCPIPMIEPAWAWAIFP
jgi:hypothetical protein